DFAYTKSPFALNPSTFVANMNVSVGSQSNWVFSYGLLNNAGNPGWLHTSLVFTASSPVTKLTFAIMNSVMYGMLLDSVTISAAGAGASTSPAGPLVEWNDPSSRTPQGVQFWISGLPGTNVPGALWANLVDTNQLPHVISTTANAITNN